MSDIRPPREPESAPETEPQLGAPGRVARPGVEPLQLRPLLPRRKSPWLVVEVDGSAGCQGALLWALREAARREATVVAVSVLDAPDGDPLEGSARVLVRAHLAAHDRLEAQVLRAIAETGVHGRTRTAVLERPVFEALMRRDPRRRPRRRRRAGQDPAPPGGGAAPGSPAPRPRCLTRPRPNQPAAALRPIVPGPLPDPGQASYRRAVPPPDHLAAAPTTDVDVAPVLTAALRAAASGSQLEATLHDIVQAAVRHVGAEYGAMGVLTADGRRLDRFVIVGMGPEDRDRIGQPPAGNGILGLLVAEPRTLRLDDLGEHPASGGFPPGHPPMRSFLGVPVRVGDSVFGNLYLTEKRAGGPFTQADVEVAQALAAVAGMAIENARHAERAEARRRWGQAATEMATALLSGADPDDVIRTVSTQVSALTNADMAGVLAPSVDDEETMTIVAGVGPAAGDFEGVRIAHGPRHAISAQVQRGRRPAADRGRQHHAPAPRPQHPGGRRGDLGATVPAMLVPLGHGARARPAGGDAVPRARAVHAATSSTCSSAFAAQASVVLELARAQQRERRLQVQTDRDRIARDLHDHVVQRIFATGLALDRISRSLQEEHPEVAGAHQRTGRRARRHHRAHPLVDLRAPGGRGRLAGGRAPADRRGGPVGDRGARRPRRPCGSATRWRTCRPRSCRTSSPWCGS